MLKVVCSIIIILTGIAISIINQDKLSVSKEQSRQKEVIESLEEAIKMEEIKTEDLNKRKEKANSDENIEEIARENFGFIKDGEIVIKPNK